MIAAAAVALGLLLGAVAGGAIRRLEGVSFRFEWPVLLLFVVQALARGRIAGASASPYGTALWTGSCIILLLLLAPDWRRPGVWVACTGMGLNVFVVALNGGMPLAFETPIAATHTAAAIAKSMGFYQIAGPGTLLGGLGDVMPFIVGNYRLLVSPGDVLLALGVLVFIVAAMTASSEPSATDTCEV